MIHQYKLSGYNIVLDVYSGSVHAVDDVAYDAIALIDQGLTREAATAQLEQKYRDRADVTPADISDCFDDIEELTAAGQLFAPDAYADHAFDFKNRSNVVKALCLHVAHDCNLRCGYCFASTGGFDGTRCLMPYEVGKKALDFLVAHSGKRVNLEVDFFGGEPMMNFDVVKRIVAYGRELEKTHNKKFRFTITTNCYDVPADAPDFCDREMHNVVLSLDGRKEVHDAVRPVHGGGGSYDRAVENARKLVAHRQDKDYYARGTFTKRNLDFAEDAEALFDAGFEHISIEPVVLEKGHPLAITEEDLPGIEAEYERLMLNVYKRRKEGRPYNFFHFMIDLSGGPCLRKRLSGCGAGREYMAVTPEGDLYPCHQFVGREQYRIGNLDDESLDETVRGRFLDNHVGKKEACRTCWAQYLCAGGCAANAEAYSGSILQPNPQECRLLKKRTECALALMTLA